MPRIRYTAGGLYTIRNGPEFTDESPTADVDQDTAERLTGRPDFELVEDEETDDEPVGQEDDEPDVDEWEDWSEDSWLEMDYQQRAEDVREGRVDDYLEEIADAETSSTVTDAVDDRRDELEG